MKILIVGSNETVVSNMTRHEVIRKVLLACVVLSSLLYVTMNILAAG